MLGYLLPFVLNLALFMTCLFDSVLRALFAMNCLPHINQSVLQPTRTYLLVLPLLFNYVPYLRVAVEHPPTEGCTQIACWHDISCDDTAS